MNIALINGQNHKGSTYHIGRMLAEALTDSDNINEIFLPRDMPEFCCGCTSCFMKDEKLCPHYQYIKPITNLIDSADILIFTTPVYVYHATGSMKALLDHYGYRWMVHRPEKKMFSKQGICISTAAGGGMKSACKDIKDSLFYWGVAKIYSYGVGVAATSWDGIKGTKKEAIIKKIKRLAKRVKARQGKVYPSVQTKLLFYVMRQMQKRGWNPVDAAYWTENGWLGGKRPWKG